MLLHPRLVLPLSLSDAVAAASLSLSRRDARQDGEEGMRESKDGRNGDGGSKSFSRVTVRANVFPALDESLPHSLSLSLALSHISFS